MCNFPPPPPPPPSPAYCREAIGEKRKGAPEGSRVEVVRAGRGQGPAAETTAGAAAQPPAAARSRMAPWGARVDPARRRKTFCPPRRRLAPGELGERAGEALAALAGAPATPATPRGNDASARAEKRPRPLAQATLHDFHTTRGMAGALTTIRPLERSKEGGSAAPVATSTAAPTAFADKGADRGAEPPQGLRAAATVDAAVHGLLPSPAAAPSRLAGVELLPACPELLGPSPKEGPATALLHLLPRCPTGRVPQNVSGHDAYLAAAVASVATQLASELEPRRPLGAAGPPVAPSLLQSPGEALWWLWQENERPRLAELPLGASGALLQEPPDCPREAPAFELPSWGPQRTSPRAPRSPDFAGAGGRWGRWRNITARLQGKRARP